MFRPRLDEQINLKHPLVRLAGLIDWEGPNVRPQSAQSRSGIHLASGTAIHRGRRRSKSTGQSPQLRLGHRSTAAAENRSTRPARERPAAIAPQSYDGLGPTRGDALRMPGVRP